jgi:hypothetical protein
MWIWTSGATVSKSDHWRERAINELVVRHRRSVSGSTHDGFGLHSDRLVACAAADGMARLLCDPPSTRGSWRSDTNHDLGALACSDRGDIASSLERPRRTPYDLWLAAAPQVCTLDVVPIDRFAIHSHGATRSRDICCRRQRADLRRTGLRRGIDLALKSLIVELTQISMLACRLRLGLPECSRNTSLVSLRTFLLT